MNIINKEVAEIIIENILENNPKTLESFEKLCDRTRYLTSDTGLAITVEYYHDNNYHLGGYRRFIIEGCRAKQVITAEYGSNKVIRKPRKSKPFSTSWNNNFNGDEILERVKEYLKNM